MFDIVLVNQIDFSNSLEHPQIGQMILANILKPKYKVEIVNFDYLNINKILNYKDDIDQTIISCGNYILKCEPKIVGFYTICNSFIYSVEIAKYIKNKNQDIKIILGGPHASLTARECLDSYEFIDAVSIGESELIIEMLIDSLINNKSLGEVKNIAYREGNEIIFNDKERLLTNVELSEYTVFDYAPFDIKSNITFELEGGRGCPYGCTFCSTSLFWERDFRIKPVKILIDEMVKINKLYGITLFSILHDMFTSKKDYLLEFCEQLIKGNFGYKWCCSSRVDVLDDSILNIMKQSGCYAIYVGVETGSQRMQEIVNKNLHLDDVLYIIEKMHKMGLDVTASFIYCYPDETVDDFKDTERMIEKLFLIGINAVQLHRFMPLPATIEYEKIKDKLYFNENAPDLSIYHKKYFSFKLLEEVKSYPAMFSQYYTFDSIVNNEFPLYDYFMYLLMGARIVFKISIKNSIKHYGMHSLYEKVKKELKIFFDVYHGIDMHNDDFEENDIVISCNILLPYLDEICIKTGEIYITEIYRYEKTKYDYYVNHKAPYIYCFDIDIEDILKNDDKVIYNKIYIKFQYKDNKVQTKKISPLYKVIDELKAKEKVKA